ncbi:hypothetical protein CEXT_109291 [Caerostris extrusa]|uniref:Maturase K n=1 Tax=Caerostris extrusa TaxID=172846 RepID=A0AAV4UHC0_CAEEX|nr:hypothetical protein CEXT_109291 [Caerostris extrusa]
MMRQLLPHLNKTDELFEALSSHLANKMIYFQKHFLLESSRGQRSAQNKEQLMTIKRIFTFMNPFNSVYIRNMLTSSKCYAESEMQVTKLCRCSGFYYGTIEKGKRIVI